MAFNYICYQIILNASDNFKTISDFSAATAESPSNCPQDARLGWGCRPSRQCVNNRMCVGSGKFAEHRAVGSSECLGRDSGLVRYVYATVIQ